MSKQKQATFINVVNQERDSYRLTCIENAVYIPRPETPALSFGVGVTLSGDELNDLMFQHSQDSTWSFVVGESKFLVDPPPPKLDAETDQKIVHALNDLERTAMLHGATYDKAAWLYLGMLLKQRGVSLQR